MNHGSLHRFRVEKSRRPYANDRSGDRSTDQSSESSAVSHQPRHGKRLSPLSCKRCKRLKRKCDRTLPECRLCTKANVTCRFPDSSTPAVNSRIEWLSSFVDSLLPGNLTVESLETGTDLYALAKGRDITLQYDSHSPIETPVSVSTTVQDAPDHASSQPQAVEEVCSVLPIPRLPSGITVLDLITAYFRQFHRTYPFLEKDTVLAEMEAAADAFSRPYLEITPTHIKLYLVLAMGCEIHHRARQTSYDTLSRFQVPYHEVVRLCVGDPSIDSTQILLLLAMFSMHDPTGWPPWIITSLLGRQAVSIGLNRNRRSDTGLSRAEMEARHRLFWSIFSTDRVISVSYGLPFAIDEDDINVPLPAVTMDEFAAPHPAEYFTTLQIARQSIALRQLEGRLISQVHYQSHKDLTQPPDRRACRRIIENFRDQVEDWYTQGCLYARVDQPDVPYHSTISWLNANYHRLLALLYCPSPLNSEVGPADAPQLQRVVQKYVQSLQAQIEDGHMAMNHVSIARLLATCRQMLHCCVHCRSAADLSEMEAAAAACEKMMGSFAPAWKFAQPCRLVFQQLEAFLKDATTSPEIASRVQLPGAMAEWHNGVLGSIIGQCESLIRQVMGDSSVYNYLADEREAGNTR